MRLGPLHFAGLGQATVEDDVERAAISFPETLRSRLLGGELLLGVVVKLAQQPAFEVGVGGFWRGMLRVPDGELVAFERLVVALDHWFFLSEFEVAVQPGIKRRARDGVVVVRKMFAALEHHVVRRIEQGVELFQFGKSFRGHLLRPIVRASHPLRLGREQAGELDVAGVYPEEAGVFTGAAALHRGAHHDGRERERHARINRGEKHRLRAAAAGARDGDATRIDFRQA